MLLLHITLHRVAPSPQFAFNMEKASVTKGEQDVMVNMETVRQDLDKFHNEATKHIDLVKKVRGY